MGQAREKQENQVSGGKGDWHWKAKRLTDKNGQACEKQGIRSQEGKEVDTGKQRA